MDRTYPPVDSLMEQAASIVRRKKEATGTLEPTEGYQNHQAKELIKFADTARHVLYGIVMDSTAGVATAPPTVSHSETVPPSLRRERRNLQGTSERFTFG